MKLITKFKLAEKCLNDIGLSFDDFYAVSWQSGMSVQGRKSEIDLSKLPECFKIDKSETSIFYSYMISNDKIAVEVVLTENN